MKVEKITVDWLNIHNACKEGIDFFKRNNLEGFPVSLVDQIKGDYDGFVSWIKHRILYEYGYDEKGNKIWMKDIYGNEHTWEYGYDQFGNLIWEKDRYENEWEYGYDERGNLIWRKGLAGDEYNYEVEYYEDGQLKKYRDLYIPWFEKN